MNKKLLATITTLAITALAIGAFFIFRSDPLPYSVSDSDKTLEDYYTAGQQLARGTETQKTTTTFLAVGDISLSRNIAQTIKVKNDVRYPFYGVAELLKSTDFNFGNLETPFGGTDNFTPKNTLVFNAPLGNIQSLVDYNFKVLNLANNHALDQGKHGLLFTREQLQNVGIHFMGIGSNLDEAWTPAVYESNGITIGFIGASYASSNDGGKAVNEYVARIEDIDRLKSSILNLKSSTDFIVVTMHAGTEYVRTPNQGQMDFAHAAIDFGADIVIGHHSHWIQTIEEYKGKYIFYSLGNFIFDQSWSQDTMEGLTLKIKLSKLGCHSGPRAGIQNHGLDAGSVFDSERSDSRTEPGMTHACPDDLQGSHTPTKIDSIELIPVIIKENCCPSPALSVEAQQILKKVGVKESIIK